MAIVPRTGVAPPDDPHQLEEEEEQRHNEEQHMANHLRKVSDVPCACMSPAWGHVARGVMWCVVTPCGWKKQKLQKGCPVFPRFSFCSYCQLDWLACEVALYLGGGLKVTHD